MRLTKRKAKKRTISRCNSLIKLRDKVPTPNILGDFLALRSEDFFEGGTRAGDFQVEILRGGRGGGGGRVRSWKGRWGKGRKKKRER